MLLNGTVAIQLNAHNAIEGVRTVNTFEGIPDVPVTRFELNIKGGTNGILKNFQDLCTTPDTADATFTSHSGATSVSRPPLEIEGCSVSVLSSRITVSKSGIAKVKIACPPGDADCEGKLTLRGSVPKSKRKKAHKSKIMTLGHASYSIAGGHSETISIKLSKKARKALKAKKRLRVTAKLTPLSKLTGKSTAGTSKKVTLKQAKVKKKKRRKRK